MQDLLSGTEVDIDIYRYSSHVRDAVYAHNGTGDPAALAQVSESDLYSVVSRPTWYVQLQPANSPLSFSLVLVWLHRGQTLTRVKRTLGPKNQPEREIHDSYRAWAKSIRVYQMSSCTATGGDSNRVTDLFHIYCISVRCSFCLVFSHFVPTITESWQRVIFVTLIASDKLNGTTS